MNHRELFHRLPANPILTADHWPYPVNTVFNPAAAQVGDTTVILARGEDLRGISHLTVARSANGIDGWTVDPEPLLAPAEGVESEQWGFEDPRVVFLPELDRWAITRTAFGPAGPGVYLALTKDFVTVERHGIVRHPDDKDAALLPHRLDGTFVLIHRPQTEFGGAHGRIVLSRSPDLVNWSAPEQVLRPRAGAWWDSHRIGLGPPPLLTEHGWLMIYHGVKETVTGCRTGSSGRCVRTSVRATSRTSSSRAASSTTSRPTGCGCTTARPTRRSAWRRRSSRICSRPCWQHPKASRGGRLRGRPALASAYPRSFCVSASSTASESSSTEPVTATP